MKMHRRPIAMLLAGFLFFSCVPAYAVTSMEKDNNYAAAILQLETYLESAGNSSAELAGVHASFDALGGYEQSRFLSYYTSVLMKIADEEYDYELYMFLDMLERNQSFNAYLKETLKGSSIGSVEELKAYAHGREYEHDGANSEAIACYGECLNYFDASARYFSLQQDKDQAVYNEAAAMLSRGDLAGAYFKFSEILRYKDSKERRDSIVSLLGYTPSSSTDNLEAVTGLKAAEIKETEITISWQKSRHASSYDVYYKKHSSDRWISAGSVDKTAKTFPGLEQGTSYDFKVVAALGGLKTDGTVLLNQRTGSVTPPPRSTPAPSPKPTKSPKPSPSPTLKPTIGSDFYTNKIACGYNTTFGLTTKGIVSSVGNNKNGRRDTSSWPVVIAVKAGVRHCVGLLSNGTVVTSGENGSGQRNTDNWDNIIAISAGDKYTLGLKRNGTVVSTGCNDYGQCNTGSWTNVTAIAAGGEHAVGLRSDGTVVAVGRNHHGQCNTQGWTNIIAIAAGEMHTLGLKADGSVVAVGYTGNGRCDTTQWKNVVAIAAGNAHSIALRSDGTVVAQGMNTDGRCNTSSWYNVVAVAGGGLNTMALKSDGTVLVIGNNEEGQCNVSGWNLLK